LPKDFVDGFVADFVDELSEVLLDDRAAGFVGEPATAGLAVAVARLRFGAVVGTVAAISGADVIAGREPQTSRSAVSQSLSSSPGPPLRARKTSCARALIRTCNSAADKGAASARSAISSNSFCFLIDRVAIFFFS
jgi:hypothetical protein